MDLTVKEELFAIRFKTAERAQEFQERFNEGRELNRVVMAEARERMIENLNNLRVVDEEDGENEEEEENGEEDNREENGEEDKTEDQTETSEEKPEVAKQSPEVATETGSGEQTGEVPKAEVTEPKKEESRVDSPEK